MSVNIRNSVLGLMNIKSIQFGEKNDRMQIIPVWIKPSVGVSDKTFICFTQCLLHCLNIKYTSFQHKDDFFKLWTRHLITQSHQKHRTWNISHMIIIIMIKNTAFWMNNRKKNTLLSLWKHQQDCQIRRIAYRCRCSEDKNTWKRLINRDHEEYIKSHCYSPKHHDKSQIYTE